MTASEALYAQTFIYPYNLTHPHLPVSSRTHCTPDISFPPLLGMLLIVFFFCTSGNLYKPQPDMSFLSKPYGFVYYCIIQCNIPWLMCVSTSPHPMECTLHEGRDSDVLLNSVSLVPQAVPFM